MLPRWRSFAVARATVGLSLVAVILAASLGLIVITQPSSIIHPSTTTLTLTSISTSTQITTATTTITSLLAQNSTQTLPAGCSGNSVSGYAVGTVEVGANSPAIICVQLYEFNATSPTVANPTGFISIGGFSPFSPEQQVNGLSNFTITASSDSVTLGGPTNANEGIVVALAITAKPGTSGTYWVYMTGGNSNSEQTNPPAGTLLALYLADEVGENIAPTGVLVAGTGQPDYVPSGVTEVGQGARNCTSSFTIQGVAYDICPDIIYYRITNVTNSTQ
jgi:hypothetical protein